MLGLSVITVVLNERAGLERTIDSVATFSTLNPFFPVEHVVIDGGSTDGSLDLLSSLKLSNFRFTSEKDDGIYFAMNKGVLNAHFDYVLFINAGDLLIPQSIPESVAMRFEAGSSEALLAGFAFSAIYSIGIFSKTIHSRAYDKYSPKMPGLHQGMVYKKDILLKYPYSSQFMICGDYENYLRLIQLNYFFEPIGLVLSKLFSGGISSKRPALLYQESKEITSQLVPSPVVTRIRTNASLLFRLFVIQCLLYFSRLFYFLKIKQ